MHAMISRQGKVLNSRRKGRGNGAEWYLNGRFLIQGLVALVVTAIVLNVAFFATLQDHTDSGTEKAKQLRSLLDKTKAANSGADGSASSSLDQTYGGSAADNRRRIIDTFKDAGVELTADDIAALPTWEQIEQVVGSNAPIIYNLEKSCRAFRDAIPGVDRNIGCSGMFNSGTNLVTQLLKQNCQIPERIAKFGTTEPYYDPQGKKIGPGEAHGMRWQVPWGKHMPANYREEHATKWASQIWKESVLAVVTIRHPYAWFVSMCKNHYSAYWPHNEHGLCPHLLNKDRELVPVEVKYDAHKTHYDSLAHLWNNWYEQYLVKADFPYLMVRFEDLQFHAKNVTYQICECAGGEIRTDQRFQYIVDSAKDGPGHGKERTGMLKAWIKYGKSMLPQNGFGTADYETAVKELNHDFMTIFGYDHPDKIL
jgi:hypothetical protein